MICDRCGVEMDIKEGTVCDVCHGELMQEMEDNGANWE